MDKLQLLVIAGKRFIYLGNKEAIFTNKKRDNFHQNGFRVRLILYITVCAQIYNLSKKTTTYIYFVSSFWSLCFRTLMRRSVGAASSFFPFAFPASLYYSTFLFIKHTPVHLKLPPQGLPTEVASGKCCSLLSGNELPQRSKMQHVWQLSVRGSHSLCHRALVWGELVVAVKTCQLSSVKKKQTCCKLPIITIRFLIYFLTFRFHKQSLKDDDLHSCVTF